MFQKYETCHTHSLSCLFLIAGQCWMFEIVQSKVMLGTRIAQKAQKLSVHVIWLGLAATSEDELKPAWWLLLVTARGSIPGYGKCSNEIEGGQTKTQSDLSWWSRHQNGHPCELKAQWFIRSSLPLPKGMVQHPLQVCDRLLAYSCWFSQDSHSYIQQMSTSKMQNQQETHNGKSVHHAPSQLLVPLQLDRGIWRRNGSVESTR